MTETVGHSHGSHGSVGSWLSLSMLSMLSRFGEQESEVLTLTLSESTGPRAGDGILNILNSGNLNRGLTLGEYRHPLRTSHPILMPGAHPVARTRSPRAGPPPAPHRTPGLKHILLALVVLLLAAILIPRAAGAIVIPAPVRTRVTWSTSRADTTKVKATFLAEAEPTTGKNGDPNGIYIADPASSAYQCVGLVSWAESIPDSVPATFTRATLTLYRLNATDAPAVYDTLEIAPVTITWNEAKATWLSRAAGKTWSASGGDVDTSLAVVIRAEDIPNLCSGAADSAVTFDITPTVVAWRDHAVGSFGVRLAWKNGVAPAIRFHDNAAPEALRPVLTIETVTIRRPRVIGLIRRAFGPTGGWVRRG